MMMDLSSSKIKKGSKHPMEFSSLMNYDDDQMGVNLQPAFRPFHNMSNYREESDHENNVNEDFNEDFKEP